MPAGQDLERLVAGLSAAAYICEAPNAAIRFWNSRAVEIWGREPSVGDTDDLFSDRLRLLRDDGTPVTHLVTPTAEALRTGHACVASLAIVREDGSRLTVRFHGYPLHDATNEVTAAIGILEPFPEHHPDADTLSLSEARYRAIVEDQTDLVCRFLPDGTVTFANDAYCAFFGIRRENVIGRRYQPVVHPDDLSQVQAQVAELSPEKPVVFIENRVFRADGAVRWTQWSNRALYDHQGRLLEFQSAGRDITDRKQAEQDAARLAAIVASADVAIYATSLDGTITSWNRAAERMFGYSAAEAMGQPISIIIPEDRRGGNTSKLATPLRRDATIVDLETESVTRHGHRIPVSLTLSPITDANGHIVGISGIARDITERKRAERDLQERESRFRLMADRAPVLIWISDVENRGIYFNKPWLDFTGLPIEQQIGDGWLTLIDPTDRAAAGAYCQEHFEQRLPFTMEFRLRHCTGEYRWVQDTGQPLFLSDGTFNGYIGSCVDIHERKAAEDRIRRILEGISDAFSAVDHEWRFTYVNDRYTQLAGKTRDELLGRVCWEVFPEAQRIKLYPIAHEAVRDQQPVRAEDYYPPLDLWFETRLYPTPDGLLSFTTDISERKRLDTAREQALQRESEARAAAEEASRLKDEFLAIVSHELRTPLNAILGWARMLRDGTVAPHSVPKVVETIERNAHMQAQLVEDLLDVSRIVTGKLALRAESVDLASVVRAVVEAVGPAAANKELNLHLDLSDDEIIVFGDSRRLQQAVWNLVTNAVKFTPKGGRVAVGVRRHESDATVTVSDTGIGIPANALPFIFDRFRQADSRTTRAHGGLGLGLAIVEHVTQAHGGTVRAISEGAGRGATFELTLPIPAGPTSLSTGEASAAERPDLTGRRVLVVDDDPDALELVRAILESCGAAVITVACVAEALEAVDAGAPDVIIGDIGMPGQDGFDLIRLLRQASARGRIPALALTAYASARHREAALHAGYDAHLGKPVDPDALCAIVADLCHSGASG